MATPTANVAPVPDSRVTVAGRRLEVQDLPGTPDRGPIVLLHEGLGSVSLWREFPTALQRATGRRTVAFSRFGHGRSEPSPWPTDHLGFHHREARDTLPEMLSALGLEAPLLLGHSDGASIALIHAAQHAVAGVVAIAPHVFVEPITLAGIRATQARYGSELRDRLARYHHDVDATFAGWSEMWLDPEFARWDLEADLTTLTAPLLLIQGAADPYGTSAQLDRIERFARGPVTRLEPPGGHSPHLEQPDEIVAAVADFASHLR